MEKVTMVNDALVNSHTEQRLVDDAALKVFWNSRDAAKRDAGAANQIISSFHLERLKFFKLLRRDVITGKRAIVVNGAILLVNLESLSTKITLVNALPNGPRLNAPSSCANTISHETHVQVSGSVGRLVVSGAAGSLYWPRPFQFWRRSVRMRFNNCSPDSKSFSPLPSAFSLSASVGTRRPSQAA